MILCTVLKVYLITRIISDSPVLYDLTAVICHYGPAAGGGHYTCFSFNPLDEEWYEYDDHTVRRVSQDVIKSCPAYVLFYRYQI